jgi:hypothetical protein
VLRKEGEKDKERLRNLINCDWLGYSTITKKNLEEMAATKMSADMETKIPTLGSFI